MVAGHVGHLEVHLVLPLGDPVDLAPGSVWTDRLCDGHVHVQVALGGWWVVVVA